MSSVPARACDVILHEADITSLRKLIVVSAIASASIKEYVQLEKIANIDKGKTGIKDALPGPFPLVVTAEARGACDHFDFEGPAILIPMVSSTGHGDASLKRIHYQEGRYAVGTILAVLRIKNESEFSARFVYQYLSAFKDELLVSRMVGTANVSLTLSKLSDVSIPVLPIEKQREVEELMQICDRLEARQADAESAHAQLVEALLGSLTQSRDAIDFATSWQRLSNHFHTLFTTESSIDDLKQTVLQLAVMGKLVSQNFNDEPASIWITRIEREKSLSVEATGMKKKVQLSEHDFPQSLLPASWQWTALGELIFGMSSGWSPACEPYPSSSDNTWGVLKTTAVQVFSYLEKENKELPSHLEARPDIEVKAGDILLTRAGPTNRVGISCLVETTRPKLMISDKIIRFHPVPAGAYGRYIALCLNVGESAYYLEKAKSGMAASQVNISQDKLRMSPIPLPPLTEQHRIVAKVDQLIAICDQLKSCIGQARELSQELTKALIENALEADPASRPYREKGGEVVHLASYLVSKMSASPTFGRVKLMKGIYLADQHLGLELVDEYERKAAGPFAKEVYDVEQRATERGWFSHSTTTSVNERVAYTPGKNIAQATDVLREALGEARAELDRLIALLANKPTDDVEMIATLYAVWSDALAKGVAVDDDLLVHEVRNHWHDSKQRFPPKTLKHWLAWMRENQLIPTGKKRYGGRQSSLKLA